MLAVGRVDPGHAVFLNISTHSKAVSDPEPNISKMMCLDVSRRWGPCLQQTKMPKQRTATPASRRQAKTVHYGRNIC
jgi:hypothetical protein